MRAIALLYHDVVEHGNMDASGFPGHAAGTYKLPVRAFAEHMRSVAAAVRYTPVSALQLTQHSTSPARLLLTFDDGGISAHTHIAGILEQQGWVGHFLITTNHIGTPTFLSREQIRALRSRGHIIGSHSASHPTRMARCTVDEVTREWRDSKYALAQILGEDVVVASVPGGYYSDDVARAASAAGIRILFNSEPTTRCRLVDECLVVGRFGLRSTTTAAAAARIARGDRLPRITRWCSWNSKKIAKSLDGELYLKIRESYFTRSGVSESGVSR